MVSLTRTQLALLLVPLLALLTLAGSRLAGVGANEGPARAEPLVRIDGNEPSSARTRLVVHVVGAVRRPGLFRLVEGSRVADAVARAGGPTPKAELSAVNLAAPLADGQQVVVPARGAAGRGGRRRACRRDEGQPRRGDGRAARRAARHRAGHGAEDRRLARRARAVPVGRGPRRRARDRPGADRAAEGAGDAVSARAAVRRAVATNWPALLVAAACAGIAVGHGVRAPLVPLGLLAAAVAGGAIAAAGRGEARARGRRARVPRALVGLAPRRRPRRELPRRAPRRAGAGAARRHRARRAARRSPSACLRRSAGTAPLGSGSACCSSCRRSGRRRRERSSSCGRGRSRRVGPRPASTSAGGSPAAACRSSCAASGRGSSAGGAGSVASPTGCARTSSGRWRAGRPASAGSSSPESCSARTRGSTRRCGTTSRTAG